MSGDRSGLAKTGFRDLLINRLGQPSDQLFGNRRSAFYRELFAAWCSLEIDHLVMQRPLHFIRDEEHGNAVAHEDAILVVRCIENKADSSARLPDETESLIRAGMLLCSQQRHLTQRGFRDDDQRGSGAPGRGAGSHRRRAESPSTAGTRCDETLFAIRTEGLTFATLSSLFDFAWLGRLRSFLGGFTSWSGRHFGRRMGGHGGLITHRNATACGEWQRVAV